MKFNRLFTLTLITFTVWLAAGAPASAQGGPNLPPDVYADSRNRLPLPMRDELDNKHKQTYDAVLARTGSVEGLRGMAGIELHGSSGNIRFESPAGRRLIELAIIVGARHGEQNFEWSLHASQALREGLEMEIIDIVRHKQPPVGIGEKEAAIISLGREMAEQHRVSPQTYARALKALGKVALVDIAVTVAYRANQTVLIWVDQHMPLDYVDEAPLPINIIESPPDIYPQSRSRLRQREGQRPITPGRTLAPYGKGPGQIALTQAGGKYLDIMVGKPLRALARLVAARELNQQVMWTETEPEARKLGLSSVAIEVVRDNKSTTGLTEKEAMVIQMGRELLGVHHVAPETYVKAVDLFGERDALDLATEIGEHAREAGILTIFDQQLPEGVEPLLPM
jgi:4-carboxymuconolactone decarboxylase